MYVKESNSNEIIILTKTKKKCQKENKASKWKRETENKKKKLLADKFTELKGI